MEKDALFWSHETTLTSEGTSAREARNFVRGHLLDHQPELVDDVRLVASELTGLLIAYEGQGSFTISLQGGGGEVLLFMQDGFSAGTIERLRATVTPTSGDPQTHLTERLSERWGTAMTAPGGAVVWASFASK